MFRTLRKAAIRLSLTGLLFIILAGQCGDNGGGTGIDDGDNGNGGGDPVGNPPAAPAIMQLHPLDSEPTRGLWVVIHDASDDEDGFILQRQELGGRFTSVADLGANTETYEDWGLEISTNYTYRIRAYNEFGNSDWSVEKTKTSAGPQTKSVLTYTTADTYVEDSIPNMNFGDENYITVAGEGGYWGGRANAMNVFSLPTLPSYAVQFEAAFLRLCEAGGGNTIYPGPIEIFAAPILSQWDENNVTWDTRPGTWVSTYGYSVHNPNQNTCVTIDVSNVVSDWYSGVRANRGFMLFSGSAGYVPYYSREGYPSGSALLQVDYLW